MRRHHSVVFMQAAIIPGVAREVGRAEIWPRAGTKPWWPYSFGPPVNATRQSTVASVPSTLFSPAGSYASGYGERGQLWTPLGSSPLAIGP
jgi:hypothetical protein